MRRCEKRIRRILRVPVRSSCPAKPPRLRQTDELVRRLPVELEIQLGPGPAIGPVAERLEFGAAQAPPGQRSAVAISVLMADMGRIFPAAESVAMSADPDPDPDPMPLPPPEPDLEACCGNGCDPCIFDLHDLAKDDYRRALKAWRERHPDAA